MKRSVCGGEFVKQTIGTPTCSQVSFGQVFFFAYFLMSIPHVNIMKLIIYHLFGE